MRDWWKTSSIGLAGCVIAMIGFWLTTGIQHVTRAEVSEMIEKESPYVADQRLVLQSLDSLNSKIDRNNELINQLNKELTKLRSD